MLDEDSARRQDQRARWHLLRGEPSASAQGIHLPHRPDLSGYELNVPIRYESYDWPTEKGGEPILVEEYTYLNLKLNNGLTDLDFDVNNPKYQFK